MRVNEYLGGRKSARHVCVSARLLANRWTAIPTHVRCEDHRARWMLTHIPKIAPLSRRELDSVSAAALVMRARQQRV